jgi:5-(carboxyamino)imidazole ribonucleotide mutase
MVKFWRAEKSVYNTGLLLKLGASRDLSLLTISGNIAMNAAASQDTPLVGIIMGSQSDWATLEHTANMLKQLGVPFEAEVVSAHRTPRDRGIQVIIAGAGGAAHLPGMCAAKTDLPVLGVPVKSSILNGVDSLLSIVQMPAGIAVGTLAIGPAGATNAAIMAAQILGLTRPEIAKNVADFRAAQTDKVASNNIPGQA